MGNLIVRLVLPISILVSLGGEMGKESQGLDDACWRNFSGRVFFGEDGWCLTDYPAIMSGTPQRCKLGATRHVTYQGSRVAVLIFGYVIKGMAPLLLIRQSSSPFLSNIFCACQVWGFLLEVIESIQRLLSVHRVVIFESSVE
ncbi:hypothetical protein DM02DRAFT_341313 [Periconia macrospinosa]|uniref:Uncharacterized protein n=1 Tax=Periconia macrospinosa TaxID=97972 RepID=A0A2V1DWF8_9PLEO|nr:hypothetical protein DM02DRAFT_341313 [Periconia macrospinosa]